MMKMFLPLAFAAALGGCVTTEQTNDQVTKIQEAAVAACGFLPTVSTVASIVGVWTNTSPAVDLATSVASSICQSVNAKKLTRGRMMGTPMFVAPNGHSVAIHGSFVR